MIRRRLLIVASFVGLGACGGGEPASSQKPASPSAVEQPWYREQTAQLSGLVREAEAAYGLHRADDAAALIEKAEPVAGKLLGVAGQPSLAALEAASDLDDLYGRMLLANKNTGWARMMFQKNQARWRHHLPATPEVMRRRQQAETRIAECDRVLGER